MNTKLIMLATIIAVATTVNAQNFGGKLGAKLNAKLNGTDGPSKKELKEAAEDSASTFLDSKEVMKDALGISGIYYSTIPIIGKTMGNNAATGSPYKKQLKKFLVNYDEQKFSMTLHNQYSYETSNQAKWVKAAYWVSGTNPRSLGPKISTKAGGLYLDETAFDNRNYEYFAGYTVKKDLQGNDIQGAPMTSDWQSGRDLIVIEPGIILIGDLNIRKDDKLENKKKYSEVIVLYKAGKADVAAKYTREYVWDQIDAYWKKYKEASKAVESESTELAKPYAGELKYRPSDADLRKAVEQRMARDKWNETLEYVYITSDWTNEYKKLGIHELNTLVSRKLWVQVVTKRGDRCRATLMIIEQNNVYTTGSVEENFTGQAVGVRGTAETKDIDCKRAYEHKK